jgi:predicted DNA-binding protein with PD1-like motif
MSCTHHCQFLWWVCLIRYVIANFYNVMYTSLPVLMMGVFDQVCYCQLLQCHVHIITCSDDGCVWSGMLLSTFTMSCTHHYLFWWWVCLIRYPIANFYNVMYTSLPVLMLGVFDQVCYCELLQCHVHIITCSDDGCVWSGMLLSTCTMRYAHHYQFLWWVCLIRLLLSTFTMSYTHHYQFWWWMCLIRYVIVNFYNVMYISLPILMMGVFDQVRYCLLLQCHVHIITSSYDGCVWSGMLLSTFTMSCTYHYQFLWWVCLIRYVIVNFFYIYKIQSSFDFILFKSQTILITWFLDPPACLFWDND